VGPIAVTIPVLRSELQGGSSKHQDSTRPPDQGRPPANSLKCRMTKPTALGIGRASPPSSVRVSRIMRTVRHGEQHRFRRWTFIPLRRGGRRWLSHRPPLPGVADRSRLYGAETSTFRWCRDRQQRHDARLDCAGPTLCFSVAVGTMLRSPSCWRRRLLAGELCPDAGRTGSDVWSDSDSPCNAVVWRIGYLRDGRMRRSSGRIKS
jgi:hypothetical protein